MEFTGMTDEAVARTARLDTGYCNPMKLKHAVDAQRAAKAELISRGLTAEAADRLIGHRRSSD